MFDARELGILISGSSTGFNVADLKEHTVYAGGYHDAWPQVCVAGSPFAPFCCQERSQVIRWLWELLGQMEPEDS